MVERTDMLVRLKIIMNNYRDDLTDGDGLYNDIWNLYHGIQEGSI